VVANGSRHTNPTRSASDSNRAATFTPSPWMSSSSTIMSPRLTPTRTDPLIFRDRDVRSPIPRWTATAQATASTTLGNSIRMPSPVVFDDAALMFGDLGIDEFTAMGAEPSESASFVLTHEAAVADDIGGENAASRRSTRSPLNAFSLTATYRDLKPP